MYRDMWWSTPIWSFHVSPNDINFAQVLKEINNIKSVDGGRKISNEGGWQSNNINLQAETEINKLLKVIEQQAKTCFSELKVVSKYWGKITDAWININKYRDFNAPHTHARSILSGCVYIQTTANSGRIKFYRNSAEDYFYNTYCDGGDYAFSYVYYEPANYKVIIFPSYISHGVEPNESQEDRVSIAFNFEQRSF